MRDLEIRLLRLEIVELGVVGSPEVFVSPLRSACKYLHAGRYMRYSYITHTLLIRYPYMYLPRYMLLKDAIRYAITAMLD